MLVVEFFIIVRIEGSIQNKEAYILSMKIYFWLALVYAFINIIIFIIYNYIFMYGLFILFGSPCHIFGKIP